MADWLVDPTSWIMHMRAIISGPISYISIDHNQWNFIRGKYIGSVLNKVFVRFSHHNIPYQMTESVTTPFKFSERSIRLMR